MEDASVSLERDMISSNRNTLLSHVMLHVERLLLQSHNCFFFFLIFVKLKVMAADFTRLPVRLYIIVKMKKRVLYSPSVTHVLGVILI